MAPSSTRSALSTSMVKSTCPAQRESMSSCKSSQILCRFLSTNRKGGRTRSIDDVDLVILPMDVSGCRLNRDTLKRCDSPNSFLNAPVASSRQRNISQKPKSPHKLLRTRHQDIIPESDCNKKSVYVCVCVCVRVAYLLSFEVHEIHRSANTVLTFYLGWSDQKHV